VRIPRKYRDGALAQLAGDYARRLEHHALQAPLEWFNFYDFWHLPELDSPDAPR
jgi:predicted LPLAT superfamily acyltransferase